MDDDDDEAAPEHFRASEPSARIEYLGKSDRVTGRPGPKDDEINCVRL